MKDWPSGPLVIPAPNQPKNKKQDWLRVDLERTVILKDTSTGKFATVTVPQQFRVEDGGRLRPLPPSQWIDQPKEIEVDAMRLSGETA